MIYNVKVTVVDLVDAVSPEQAIRKLESVLMHHGFDMLDDDASDAFESEPLDEAILNAPWPNGVLR